MRGNRSSEFPTRSDTICPVQSSRNLEICILEEEELFYPKNETAVLICYFSLICLSRTMSDLQRGVHPRSWKRCVVLSYKQGSRYSSPVIFGTLEVGLPLSHIPVVIWKNIPLMCFPMSLNIILEPFSVSLDRLPSSKSLFISKTYILLLTISCCLNF